MQARNGEKLMARLKTKKAIPFSYLDETDMEFQTLLLCILKHAFTFYFLHEQSVLLLPLPTNGKVRMNRANPNFTIIIHNLIYDLK